MVYSDNPGGQAGFNLLTKPLLEAEGIAVTGVPIADTAGPQEFAPAIQAAGAADADVFIPLVTIQGCIGTYDALKQLGITTPVVTTGLCFGTPMTEHLAQTGDAATCPDGWYFGGYGYSYFIPGQAGDRQTTSRWSRTTARPTASRTSSTPASPARCTATRSRW